MLYQVAIKTSLMPNQILCNKSGLNIYNLKVFERGLGKLGVLIPFYKKFSPITCYFDRSPVLFIFQHLFQAIALASMRDFCQLTL